MENKDKIFELEELQVESLNAARIANIYIPGLHKKPRNTWIASTVVVALN